MQKHTFADNSFVLHKITPPSGKPGNVSAWFTSDGALIDVEYLNRAGRAQHVKRDGAFWQNIAAYGPRYLADVQHTADF